jgi:hypothetical protein
MRDVVLDDMLSTQIGLEQRRTAELRRQMAAEAEAEAEQRRAWLRDHSQDFIG